jgi:hypothetical protein
LTSDRHEIAARTRVVEHGQLPEGWHAMPLGTLWNRLNRPHQTPQTMIEAVMFSVRERGVAALKEPANIERLSRCDDDAKTEINEWIARLIAAKEIAA